MVEQELSNRSEKKEGFFTVRISIVDELVKRGAAAEELATYLVLARGAGKGKETIWGANSCSKYTGMTYYRAKQAIEWLEQQGIITKKSQKEWALNIDDDEDGVALSNALIEGIGAGRNNPPLARLENIKHSSHGMAEAKLDTLMVLIHLYRHHLLADCGGVNPRAGIYREWQPAENSYGTTQIDLIGSNAAIYEIQGNNKIVSTKFIAESLFYIDDEAERHERFWDAFNNLKELRWLYEVTQVWSSDPHQDSRAEPLYTLYVHDLSSRDTDPYLSKAIHGAALKTYSMDAYEEFNPHSQDESNIIKTGRFRYVANKKKGGFPIGIYRLKFRAWTADNGVGMQREQQNVKRWSDSLSAISSQ
jgi:hypothetical protein